MKLLGREEVSHLFCLNSTDDNHFSHLYFFIANQAAGENTESEEEEEGEQVEEGAPNFCVGRRDGKQC